MPRGPPNGERNKHDQNVYEFYLRSYKDIMSTMVARKEEETYLTRQGSEPSVKLPMLII